MVYYVVVNTKKKKVHKITQKIQNKKKANFLKIGTKIVELLKFEDKYINFINLE